jgi:hypothetical protein
MTIRKKDRGFEPRASFKRKNDLVPEIWQAFASRPNPDGPERSCLIEDRHPLEFLFDYFESLEWELVEFSVEVHRVPDHPPSRTPILGCDCVGCTGRPRLNIGWKP